MSCITQYSATFLFPQSNNIIMAFCLYWMFVVRIKLPSRLNQYWLRGYLLKTRRSYDQSNNTLSASIQQKETEKCSLSLFFGGFLLKQSDGEGAEVKKSLCKHPSFLINIYNSTWTLWLPELEAVLNCLWNQKTVQSERSIKGLKNVYENKHVHAQWVMKNNFLQCTNITKFEILCVVYYLDCFGSNQ